MKKNLRHGYTTGACAAAAAKAAALMLVNQALVEEVSIDLPAGIVATFQLHGQSFTAEHATCFVVKDAGDDPDVTNGVEVHAVVKVVPFDSAQGTDCGLSAIAINGGIGIGRVTKPGLAVPPGEWAINPVPRRMIAEAVGSVLSPFTSHNSTFNIFLSIPDGEERAQKTLNARLGIIGGLSILGTTGIVRPISAKAWTDTLDAALDVAKACGCETVVLSTGRTSEMAAQKQLPHHSEEAFIMMGDHIAYTLQACATRGFLKPVIACQFAKLLKIACGHENTHAAVSDLELSILKQWVEEAQLPADLIALIGRANTAREVVVESGFNPALVQLVINRAKRAARRHVAEIDVHFMLCEYSL